MVERMTTTSTDANKRERVLAIITSATGAVALAIGVFGISTLIPS